jgi:hypothetical protein
MVEGILVLIASGFFLEMGADAYKALKAYFAKRLGNKPDVELLVKATSEFIESEGQIVVKIGRTIRQPIRRHQQRKKH